MRRTPTPAAAATTALDPSTLTRNSDWGSGRQNAFIPAAWNTVSQPLIPLASASWSKRSPGTASAPCAATARADSSDRTRAATVRPSPSNRERIARPTTPVPPVTKALPVTAVRGRPPEDRGEPGQVFGTRDHRDGRRGKHHPLVQVEWA